MESMKLRFVGLPHGIAYLTSFAGFSTTAWSCLTGCSTARHYCEPVRGGRLICQSIGIPAVGWIRGPWPVAHGLNSPITDSRASVSFFPTHYGGITMREGAALLRRGFFALFMGLFARGCVSPVLISGGQQPSQRVPASFRRPAEPRNGAEHRRSVPLRRAPFWTFARRSGTVPWEGRQTCDGCDDRIPGTYIRRAPNLRPLHRSPEASPVRSGRCCLRGCQSLPLVQRSPADERERTRTGTAPAGPGVGAQAPARTSRPTQPERGCWSGRGHQRCRVLGAARARKPRRNGLRHDAGCGSGLRAARSRRLASARCRAEPAAGALLGRDAPPRDHRDRLAGTTAYALEATVVLDIIHVAAATRRAVLVAGSSKGLSAFGPRSDGRRPALSRRG